MAFEYLSEQTHSVSINGKSSTRTNKVSIHNNKGYKALTTNGKTVKKSLTKKELQCIKNGKFVPNLFSDCVKPLRLSKGTRRRR